MAKYRKKPVEIEAFQFEGDFLSDGKWCIPDWAVEAFHKGIMYFVGPELYINTLEGVHHCSFMDYVIRGVNGELYPCKPDIFKKTYDKVGESNEEVMKWPKRKHLA